MVKKEMDDDAPLPIPGAPQRTASKPSISRKPDGSFVIKFPDGREKPMPLEKVPQAIKDKCAAQDAQRKKLIAQRIKQEPQIKKRKLKIRDDDGPKRRSPKKVKKQMAESGDDTDADADAANQAKMRAMNANRTPKDIMIAEFLSRWWYCWEEYPMPGTSYDEALQNAGLRVVDIEGWEDEPKVKGGLKKCYELMTFPGNFRDSDGVLHDLRPNHNKPSYNYLNAMDPKSIAKLLVTAYTNQIKQIKDSPYLKLLPGGINKLEVALDKRKRQAGSH